jgi:hypothetical protein
MKSAVAPSWILLRGQRGARGHAAQSPRALGVAGAETVMPGAIARTVLDSGIGPSGPGVSGQFSCLKGAEGLGEWTG